MRRAFRNIVVFLKLLALCNCASAQFEDIRLYLGATAGLSSSVASSKRFSANAIPCTPLDCNVSIDDNGYSASLFAGVQLNEFLGLEVGYADLPDSYKVILRDPNFPPPTYVSVDQDSDTFFLRGVVTLPFSKFGGRGWLTSLSLSGVAGISRWESESTLIIDLTGAGGGISRRQQQSGGTDVTYGARLNYDLTRNVRLSAAWDVYRNLGAEPVAVASTNPPLVGTVTTDMRVFSVGVAYRFE